MTQISVDQMFEAAMQQHRVGRFANAESLYRLILVRDPQHADALHMFGVLNAQAGRYDAAIDLIRRALMVRPTHTEAQLNLGLAQQAAGQLDAAIASFSQAVSLAPDHPQAQLHLALALHTNGQLQEAIAAYRRALTLDPTNAPASNNLGVALQSAGRLEEAQASFRLALSLQPDHVEAHNNLGNVLRIGGHLEAASASIRRALELRPDYVEAHNNLGLVYKAQARLADARASFQRALAIKPDCLEPLNNFGAVLQDQGDLEGALTCFRRVLALSPNHAQANSNLAAALHTVGQLDEAAEYCERALSLKPDAATIYSGLAGVLVDQGQLDEAILWYRRAMALPPDDPACHSALIFALLHHPAYSQQAIHEETLQWNRRHAAPFAGQAASRVHANDPAPDRRLRIGYVSPDFRTHPVGRFMRQLLAAHDHHQFELFCYASVACPDELMEQCRKHADVWRDVAGLTDEQLAQQIGQDRIDILIDLALHTTGTRLLAFARKPAPLQLTFAGYPGGTGLNTIDYRLTDRYLDPENVSAVETVEAVGGQAGAGGGNDACFAEESIRLPDSFWCYDPMTSEPPVNNLPALAKEGGGITFGCLNTFCKVTPDALQLWARVLQSVPNSRLMLLTYPGSHRQRTLETLAKEGVDPARVQFVAKRPRAEYFRLFHELDIGLDSFPYNGHMTSLDAYWMGVPVVTLVGRNTVSRAGLSQLTNLGLPELIAHTPEEYVRIAVELAGNLPRLAQLRSTLRGRMESSPLMDAPRYARNIEAVYRTLWQKWCAKASPR